MAQIHSFQKKDIGIQTILRFAECLEPMEAKVQNLDFQMTGLTRSLNRLEITAKFLKEILESILHLEFHVG